MSSIGDVVDITIEIENPVTDSASFSNILLVAPGPSTAGKMEMPEVIVISAAKDLAVYGYTEEDEAYRAAVVAFMQEPSPDEVYVIARKTKEDGNKETIAECLDRATVENWYGFSLVSEDTTATEIEAAAKWAEENNHLFGFAYTSGRCPINLSTYNRTFGFYAGNVGDQIPDGNLYAAAAFMAKCFGYTPGTESWGFKTLNGVTASNLSAAEKKTFKDANVNYYHSIANKAITQEGKVGSGEWIDVIRFRDWLINQIQIRVFNFIVKNQKVPYNDSGITGIQNILEAVLSEAQEAGGIDQNRYNEDEELEKGYEVIVPRSSDISTIDKKQRKLTGVSFVARLAGAIHEVAIRGTLVY